MTKYLAHSKNADGAGVPEPLKTHLDCVATCAKEFASALNLGQQAYVAGLLHDLGKYGDQFQRRLDDSIRESGRDHSSAGALLATKCSKHLGLLPALAIEGHHIGLQLLQTRDDLRTKIANIFKGDANQIDPKRRVLTESNLSLLLERFRADGLAPPKIIDGLCPTGEQDLSDMLDVRMLFSTLVDADFLGTEAHFNGDATVPVRPRPEGPMLDPARAFEAVCRKIDGLASSAKAKHVLLDVRNMLIKDCLRAATSYPPNIFTLSAPTGAGKTLSMLAFALRHAAKHGLRRIIVVMPFLSIIDQTAKIYREIFSESNGFAENFVIEDHSNVRPETNDAEDSVDDTTRLDRLLAENWDAPIVLTTNVQCLESLMANRPSACRKLHRLANSVILFDEVQTIPPKLAVPTLATLSRLCERFGASVVFSTATQPAFDHLDEAVKKQAASGWKPIEITSNSQKLFQPSASRIKVRWRHDKPIPWDTLTYEIEKGEETTGATQALCILNVKRHAQHFAQLVHDRVDEGTFHLSTTMCPEHRKVVLDEVIQRLKESQPVRLIATQCVEAGIDIDFPVVYRALGPLDSIAQAAGRCNRKGLLENAGMLHVFKPEEEVYPGGGYKQAVDVTKSFLKQLQLDGHDLDKTNILNNPERLREYYQLLYTLSGTGEEDNDLTRAIEACDFVKVAEHYRLVRDSSIHILVPYDREQFEKLRDETQRSEFHNPAVIRRWIRNARPYTVSLHRPPCDSPQWNFIEPVQFSGKHERSHREISWFLALECARYDPLLGWCEGDGSLVC